MSRGSQLARMPRVETRGELDQRRCARAGSLEELGIPDSLFGGGEEGDRRRPLGHLLGGRGQQRGHVRNGAERAIGIVERAMVLVHRDEENGTQQIEGDGRMEPRPESEVL
jgi:hypothetical protein